MKEILMRSLRPHIYSGEPRKAGSVYIVTSERDARVMTMAHNAVLAQPGLEVEPLTATDAVEATEAKKPGGKKPAKPKKPPGRYIRRDQRAES